MKKLFLLVMISFLLQSCFSYKKVNTSPDQMIVGKKYKIERHNKFSKVLIKSINDSTAVVSGVSSGRKERHIPLKEITQVRERKFSIIKTVALIPAVAVTAAVVYVVSDPDIPMGEIQGPN